MIRTDPAPGASGPPDTLQSPATPSVSEHIGELDGLRALAVALVMLYHFGPSHSVPFLQYLKPLGWSGVDLFFVLSGFLITRILLATRTERLYYSNFYIRRSLRIFPAYYAVLILIYCGAVFYQHGAAYQQLAAWGNPIWPWLYLGNVQTALIGRDSPLTSLGPLWSLHVEEQFYLLFPFIVRNLPRQSLVRLLIGAVFAAPALRCILWHVYRNDALAEYVFSFCRLEGLALGALIAAETRYIPRITRGWLAAAAVGSTVLAFALLWFLGGHGSRMNDFTRTIGFSLFPCAFACSVLWVIRFRGSVLTHWLNAAPLQFIGKRSYGIYLLQFPVKAACTALVGSEILWANELVGFTVVAALTVGAATLSWWLLEAPMLRLKNRWAPSATPAAAAGRLVRGARTCSPGPAAPDEAAVEALPRAAR